MVNDGGPEQDGGDAAPLDLKRTAQRNGFTAFRLVVAALGSFITAIIFRDGAQFAAIIVSVIAVALVVGPVLSRLLVSTKAVADFDQSLNSTSPLGGRSDPISPVHLRQVLILAVTQLWALAAFALASQFVSQPYLQHLLPRVLFFIVFCFAILAPLTAYGVTAIASRKLPPRPGLVPEHKHITGFGALSLVGAVVSIVLIASWATSDQNVSRTIHAQWGAWIVYALAFAFLLTAVVPSFSVPPVLLRLSEGLAILLRPLGRALSAVDSLLVHCVAPAAGATLRRRWLGRYAYLAAYLVPLGLLGYFLPAPLGLVPIGWALIAAVSISRRWAWVEDDRETAMLTAQFRSENLRVGFDQDLRDEALLGFMSMFFLVPLALRQAHEWGAAYNVAVFTIRDVDTDQLFHWIQYFGAELAKAVPFVDWAEIYDVEGDGPIEMASPISRHVVFAARVLVDLVFLAALLQALATLSRNAKQLEMFREGDIDRLDPFIEREQFQRIVTWQNGRWARLSPTFENFSAKQSYSLTRLLELKEDKVEALRRNPKSDRHSPEWAVWAAAELLYDRDYRDADIAAELHMKLREESGEVTRKAPKKDAVDSVLDELEKPSRSIQIDDLDDVRRYLSRYSTAWPLRQRIIALIARDIGDVHNEDYEIRVSAMASTLAGPNAWDSRAPNRRIAFEALRTVYLRGEREAVLALSRAAQHDQAPALRSEIAAFVIQNPREPGPASDEGPLV